MRLEIEIEGSSGSVYVITLRREGDNLYASCTCPAGEKRIHCKHRLAILIGDGRAVRGKPWSDLAPVIEQLIEGTDLASALMAYRTAELDVAQAESRLKAAKKQLDRVMHQ